MAGEKKQLSTIETILEKAAVFGAVYANKEERNAKISAALNEIIKLIDDLKAKETERHAAELLNLTKEQREILVSITKQILPIHPDYAKVKTFFEQYIYLEIINDNEQLQWRIDFPDYVYSDPYEECLNIIDGIKNSELRDAYKKRLTGLNKSFDFDKLEGLTADNLRQFVDMVNTKLATSDGYNIKLQEGIINALGMSKHFALPNIEFHKISTADKPPTPGPSAEEIAARERARLEEQARKEQENEASRKRVAEEMKKINSLSEQMNKDSSLSQVNAEIEHTSSQTNPLQETTLSASRIETAQVVSPISEAVVQNNDTQHSVTVQSEIPECKIQLRVEQTAKMMKDKKLQDSSVRIVAPRWVEAELAKLSEKLQGKKFVFYEGEKKLERSFTVNGPLTLAQLLMISRNEAVNGSGNIQFDYYPEVDKEIVYALKDLVRHCVTVGTDVATHEGGYKVDLVKKKKVEKVYICDLAALQFQKNFNSGRLVLVGEKLPKGMLDDAIYQATVGQKKPSLEECKKDITGRFVKLNGAQPQRIYCANDVGRNPPEELYFDTYAHSRFVQQDFVLAGLTLNALAENNGDEINFKFLKYGAGFFAQAFDGDPEMDPNTQERLTECLLQGAYDGLQELFAHNPSKIKRVEFPFYISESPSPKVLELKEKIEKLCQMNGRECGFEKKDALHKTSAKYVTATTTTADPHAMAGNEMNHGSVDAAISENIQSKGNKFSPAINSKMTFGYVPLSPEQEIKNILQNISKFAGELDSVITLERREIRLAELQILVKRYKTLSVEGDNELQKLEQNIKVQVAKYEDEIKEAIKDLGNNALSLQEIWLDIPDGSNKSWLKRNPEKMLLLAETNKDFAKLLSQLATEDVRFAAKLFNLVFKDTTDKNKNLREVLLADIKKLDRGKVEEWIKVNKNELLHNVGLVKLLAENNFHFAGIFITQEKFAKHFGQVEIANMLSKHEPKHIYDLIKGQSNKIDLLTLLAQHHPDVAQKISGLIETDFNSINTAIMSKWAVSGVNNFNEIKELYALINKLEILKSEFDALSSQSYTQQCDELLGVVGRLEVKEFRALNRAEVEELVRLSSPELFQDIKRISTLAENNYHFALLYLQNKHTDKWSVDALVKILSKYESNDQQKYSLFRAVVSLASKNAELAKDLFSKHANLFSPEQLYAIAKANGNKQTELFEALAQHNPEKAKKVSQVKVQIHDPKNSHSAKGDDKQSFAESSVGLAELAVEEVRVEQYVGELKNTSYEFKQAWVGEHQQFLVENKNILLEAALADYSLALLILREPPLVNILSQAEVGSIINQYALDPDGKSSNRKGMLLVAINRTELSRLAEAVDVQPVNNSENVRALYKLINEVAALNGSYGNLHKTKEMDQCKDLQNKAIKKLLDVQFFELAKSDYNFAKDLFTNAGKNRVAANLSPEQTFEIIHLHENREDLLNAVGRFDTSRRNVVEASIRKFERKQAMDELANLKEKTHKLQWIDHYLSKLKQDPHFILEAALADKFIAQIILGDIRFAAHLNDAQIVNILSKYLTTDNKVDKNIFWAALKAAKNEGEADKLIGLALKAVSNISPPISTDTVIPSLSSRSNEDKAKELGSLLERITAEFISQFGPDGLAEVLLERAMKNPSVVRASEIYRELSGKILPKQITLVGFYELANAYAPRSTVSERRSQYNDYTTMPPMQSPDREKLDVHLQKEQEERNKRLQDELRKHLEPYWSAMIKALENVDKDPVTAYYKATTFFNEIQKYNLGEAQISFLKSMMEKYPSPESIFVRILIFKKYAEELDNDTRRDLDKHSDEILKSIDATKGTSYRSPLERKDFPKIIASHQNLIRSGEFLKTKPKVGVHQLKRLVGKHDKAGGLPIDLVVDYIIAHPESAGRFFKKPTLGSRNFREELSKNPDLLHKLIDAGIPKIWEKMEHEGLLDSSHMQKNLNQVEISTLKKKLEEAPGLVIQKQPDVKLQQKISVAKSGDVDAIIELAQQHYLYDNNNEFEEYAKDAARMLAGSNSLTEQQRKILDNLKETYSSFSQFVEESKIKLRTEHLRSSPSEDPSQADASSTEPDVSEFTDDEILELRAQALAQVKELQQQSDISKHNRQDCLDAIKNVQHPFYRELLEAAIKKQVQGFEFPSKAKMERFVAAVNTEMKVGITYQRHLDLIQDHELPFLTAKRKGFEGTLKATSPTPTEHKQQSPHTLEELAAARRRADNHNRSSGPK